MGVTLAPLDRDHLRELVTACLVDLGPDADPLAELALRAQHSAWAVEHGEEGHRTVLLDGRPVGRVWTVPEGAATRVVDLLVDPGVRSSGVGGVVVALLLAQGRPLVTSVPAEDVRVQRFWLRAGFSLAPADEELLEQGLVELRHPGLRPPPSPPPRPRDERARVTSVRSWTR